MFIKQIATCCMVIFFLAQFGKVINFCFCTAAAYHESKTLSCDCEKQLYSATGTANTDKTQAIGHTAVHQQSDELFHSSQWLDLRPHQSFFYTPRPFPRNEALSLAFGKKVFRPPIFRS
ncbi:MAG: hypothetical protein ABIU63_18525 [Chitinophagaceae bacterium]